MKWYEFSIAPTPENDCCWKWSGFQPVNRVDVSGQKVILPIGCAYYCSIAQMFCFGISFLNLSLADMVDAKVGQTRYPMISIRYPLDILRCRKESNKRYRSLPARDGSPVQATRNRPHRPQGIEATAFCSSADIWEQFIRIYYNIYYNILWYYYSDIAIIYSDILCITVPIERSQLSWFHLVWSASLCFAYIFCMTFSGNLTFTWKPVVTCCNTSSALFLMKINDKRHVFSWPFVLLQNC